MEVVVVVVVVVVVGAMLLVVGGIVAVAGVAGVLPTRGAGPPTVRPSRGEAGNLRPFFTGIGGRGPRCSGLEIGVESLLPLLGNLEDMVRLPKPPGLLVASEVDLGGSENSVVASGNFSCVGDNVGSDELFVLRSASLSDVLIRDSPELLEYADRKLRTDLEGEGGSAGSGGASTLPTGLLGMDMAGGRVG